MVHRPTPTGEIVVGIDGSASSNAAIRWAAHEAGIAVPKELSIVGFDDIELAAFSTPALTTVAQPKQQIGTIAAEMMLERMEKSRSEERRVILEPQLKLRASTALYLPGKD